MAKSPQLNIQLRGGRKRLHAVFDTFVESPFTIDDRGIIDAANEAAGRLFGYSRDEPLGNNISILMPEPFHSEHDGYLRAYL